MNKNKGQGNNLDYGILTELLGYHVRLAQVSIFRDFAARGFLNLAGGCCGLHECLL